MKINALSRNLESASKWIGARINWIILMLLTNMAVCEYYLDNSTDEEGFEEKLDFEATDKKKASESNH